MLFCSMASFMPWTALLTTTYTTICTSMAARPHTRNITKLACTAMLEHRVKLKPTSAPPYDSTAAILPSRIRSNSL
ncbi:hypothetical protein D3C77_690590 [compost metagenome]